LETPAPNPDHREIFKCLWSGDYGGNYLLGQNRQVSELCFIIERYPECVRKMRLTDKKAFASPKGREMSEKGEVYGKMQNYSLANFRVGQLSSLYGNVKLKLNISNVFKNSIF